MRKLNLVLFNIGAMTLLPGIAGAAGTYYNGNMYQRPQYSAGNGGYYNSYGAGRGGYAQYNNNAQMAIRRPVATNKSANAKNNAKSKKQGFVLNADLTHEIASWKFDMKNAGSKLHYDNVNWNVLSGEGTYYFGDSTPMQIKVGARYGMQFGESPMVDDDISTEAMWQVDTYAVQDPVTGNLYEENIISGNPAISIGTSQKGTQFGFNAAFGLTDFFKLGNMKLTPSVGYRYFKYKLTTEKNYGATVNVVDSYTFVNCLEVQPGEIQCSPYIGFANNFGDVEGYAGFALSETYVENETAAAKDIYGNTVYIWVNHNGTYQMLNDTGMSQISSGNTYYYEQSGKTHVYETTWAGPYVALDMDYVINENNSVTAGVEFGLPVYDSKGDQPYRFDWAHPTSVEDKGSLGDAYHLGLNAMWTTAVSDSVGLSFGFTYDYYTVNGATAKTFYNSGYNQDILDWYEERYANGDTFSYDEIENWDSLDALKSAGWVAESKNEINSVYKSMGIRIGINAKF